MPSPNQSPPPNESSTTSSVFEEFEALHEVIYRTKEGRVFRLHNLRWSFMPQFIEALTEEGQPVILHRTDVEFRLKERKSNV